MTVRRRSRLTLLPLAAVALTLSGCGALTGSDDGAAASTDGAPQVVAGFYPLAWATQQVAGDRFEVANLTTPGAEAHDLELGIGETAELTDADLVVFEAGFQPAVDAAVEENASGEVLDAAEVVDLLPAAEDDGHDHGEEDGHSHEDEEGHSHDEEDGHSHDEEDGHSHDEEDGHSHDEGSQSSAPAGGSVTAEPVSEEEHDHDHGDADPHFWQDPMRMADLADAVADSLADLDPDGAETYADNAATLRTELSDLDAAYAEGLAGCERDMVVVNHGAFGYLGKYGLEFEAITGLTPDAEPTPAARAQLEQVAAEEGVTTVFSETLVSQEAARSLADDLGVEMRTLDPIEGLSDDTADEDYLSLMRTNLTALQAANGC